jgi:hypothetical protein
MAFSPRHLVAAGAMAGALVLSGATWAAAQDSPSTTGDDSTTTTTEQDRRSDDGRRSDEQAPRSREGCRHGGNPSDRDGSDDGGSSGTGDAEASAFWS